MKVVLAGSTGMIGGLILQLCIESSKVEEVVALVRKSSVIPQHPKVTEVVVSDFADYSNHFEAFDHVTVAFFCIGVYTGQVSDDLFKKITVDFAVAFASALEQRSPGSRLCLLSGQGADRSEKSKTAFARYKGIAENRLSQLNLQFHTFRPAYIYPTTGRQEPNMVYRISRLLYPIIRLLGVNFSIQSTQLAKAMFNVGMKGAKNEVLENRDILKEV